MHPNLPHEDILRIDALLASSSGAYVEALRSEIAELEAAVKMIPQLAPYAQHVAYTSMLDVVKDVRNVAGLIQRLAVCDIAERLAYLIENTHVPTKIDLDAALRMVEALLSALDAKAEGRCVAA